MSIMKRTNWWKRLVTRKQTSPRGRCLLHVEQLEVRCTPSANFRSIDEVGNNAANPYQGVSFFTSSTEGTTPAQVAGGDLLRFSAVAYKDGFSTPSMGGGAPTF